jgi:hypothetical protein
MIEIAIERLQRALGHTGDNAEVTIRGGDLRMLLADYDLAKEVYERWDQDKLMEVADHEDKMGEQAGEYEQEMGGLREQIAELKAEARQLQDRLAEDVMA